MTHTSTRATRAAARARRKMAQVRSNKVPLVENVAAQLKAMFTGKSPAQQRELEAVLAAALDNRLVSSAQLADQQASHDAEIIAQRTKWERAIQKQHDVAMQSKIERLQKTHAGKMEDLQRQHIMAMHELEATSRSDLEQLQQEHDATIEMMREDHEQEMDTVKSRLQHHENLMLPTSSTHADDLLRDRAQHAAQYEAALRTQAFQYEAALRTQATQYEAALANQHCQLAAVNQALHEAQAIHHTLSTQLAAACHQATITQQTNTQLQQAIAMRNEEVRELNARLGSHAMM